MIRVLAFDPGHTTGWAVFEKAPDQKDPTLVARGTIVDWHGMQELYDEYKPTTIVYEIFRLYAWKANVKAWDTFLEVEVIGVLRYLAMVNNLEVVEQTPSDGKHFFNDARLKKMDLYDGVTHVRDATSHALFAFKFNLHKLK